MTGRLIIVREHGYKPPRPIFMGFALVTIGLLFLLRELGALPEISFWAFVWLGIGGWLFLGTILGNRRGWFWPLTLLLIGIFMLLRDIEVIDQDFAIWPIVILGFGLAILAEAFTRRG